jgi:hypothetical protein
LISQELKYRATEIANKRVEANKSFYKNTYRERGDAFTTEYKGILAELLAQEYLTQRNIVFEAADFIQQKVENKPDIVVNGLRVDVKGCIGRPKVNKQTAEKTDIDVYLFYIFNKDYTKYKVIKCNAQQIKEWQLITINQNNQFYTMEEITFLGNAWSDDYGINVTINLEKFEQAIRTGKLEKNKYGDVRIRVQKLKAPNDKSKATHYVAVPKPPKESPF